ncbi:PspA/IM30 family protein [Undibacterium sp. JH2W]|uniref:PspA/IM30 family protein n=1 Tax=Undibacterium sp. JH2W TaxID=3413037 RepID=UPI003BF4123F
MAVFSKILTMLRGNLREIGQSVVDQNASSIYEQEIVEAKAHVAKAKQNLTAVMAKEMQTGREIERLQAELARYEELALQAMQKNELALAEEVAGKLANLEIAISEQHSTRHEFAENINKLKDMIRNAETSLREHERQLAMAKTTESVYQATATISQTMGASGSKLLSAKESLERIKQRHQDMADQMHAADELENELGGKALDQKLAAAGIGQIPDQKAQVLARLHEKFSARQELSIKPANGEAVN